MRNSNSEAINIPKLLSTSEAAKVLDVCPQTLRLWRFRQRYALAYIRVGGHVRYSEADLLRFLESHRVTPKPRTRAMRKREAINKTHAAD